MKLIKQMMINTIRKYLFLIYITLIPLIYISYIIYRRLFVVRLPRDLFIPLSTLQTFFITLAILFLLLRLRSLLIAEDYISYKEPKSWFFVTLNNIFSQFSRHLNTIRYNFYNVTIKQHKIAYSLILKTLKFLAKVDPPAEALYFGLEILPKLVVVSCFLIDIFIFKQFYYFYKVLGLLLIPLVIKFKIYVFTRFALEHTEPMIDSLTSKPIPGTDLHEFCFKDSEVGYLFIKNIHDFIENHFGYVFDINYILYTYYFIEVFYYFNRINLVITSLYLIGWSTILLGSFLAS